MSSNAYLATDGEKLMKVGKANNPKRREKQIDLTITLTVACLDEMSAYRIEDQLRQFIAERGGIKHASTVDWFAFDPQIYRMVCEFAANLDGYKALSEEESQDAEIDVLRRRYFKLLVDEGGIGTKENSFKVQSENLQRKIIDLEAERDRLHQELEVTRNQARETLQATRKKFNEKLDAEHTRFLETLGAERTRFHKEIDEERKEKYALSHQLSEWRGMFIGIKQALIDRGDKPMRPTSLLNVLKSLVPEIFE